MVSYGARKKSCAKKRAEKARKKGYSSSVYKKKKGWGVSVTRK